MVKRLDTNLDSYDFLPEEQLAARMFSTLQLQNIKTELAASVMTKAYMSPLACPSNENYLQQQEFYRGMIQAYQFLIEGHEAAISQLQSEMEPN